jgi:hypothetical protein
VQAAGIRRNAVRHWINKIVSHEDGTSLDGLHTVAAAATDDDDDRYTTYSSQIQAQLSSNSHLS